MHERESQRYQKRLKWLFVGISLIALLGGVIYMFRFGNTDNWPQASCSIVGSRVVRDVVSFESSRAIVMYRGEYRVRYTVGGQNYYIWVSGGPSDGDRSFVEASVNRLPDECYFKIRYNRGNPSEAVQVQENPWKLIFRSF